MESVISKKRTTKNKSKGGSKSDEEETGMEFEGKPRVVLTPLKGHSRASSVSSNITDDLSRQGISSTSKRRKYDTEVDNAKEYGLENPSGSCLMPINEERELEKFLFEESNKVSRPIIKYILET